MKLSRLYQPRHPAFWLIVVLNLLSTALAWVARSFELAALPALLVAAVAVINAVISLRLMIGLMRDDPSPTEKPGAP